MTDPRANGTPNPSSASPLRASDLLALGKPFVHFPQYSILDLKQLTESTAIAARHANGHATRNGAHANAEAGVVAGFSDWLSKTLQAGQPFVIRDFDKLGEWDDKLFSIGGLIEHSTKKSRIASFSPVVRSRSLRMSNAPDIGERIIRGSEVFSRSNYVV